MLLLKLKMLKRWLFILLMIQLSILTFVIARRETKRDRTTRLDLCNKFEEGSVYRDVQNGCKARLRETIKHQRNNRVEFSLHDVKPPFMCRMECRPEALQVIDLVSVTVKFEFRPNTSCTIRSCKEWMKTEQKRINQQIFKQYTIEKTDPPYSCEFKNDAQGDNRKTIQITTNAKLIFYDLNYQANYKIVKCESSANLEAHDDEEVRYTFIPHTFVYSLEMQCSDSSKFNLRSQETNNHKTIDMENECEPGSLEIVSIVQDGRKVKFCRVLEHDGAYEEDREESRNPVCVTVMTSRVRGRGRNRRVSNQMHYMEPIHRCTIKCGSYRFHALSISTEVFSNSLGSKCEIETCEQWMTSKSSVKGESFKEYKILQTDPPKNCIFKSGRGIDSKTRFSIATNMVNYIYDLNMEEEYTFESCTRVIAHYSFSKERHTLLPHRPYFDLSLKCSEFLNVFVSVTTLTQHEYDRSQLLSSFGGTGCHVDQVRASRHSQDQISVYLCGVYGEESADEDARKTHPGCKLIMTIIENVDKQEVTYQMQTVIPIQRCSLICGYENRHVLSISSQTIKIDKGKNCELTQCEEMVTSKVVTMTSLDVKQYKILKYDPPQICTFKRKWNNDSKDTYIVKTNVENIIYVWNSEDDYWIENCLEDYQPEIEVKHGLPPLISVFTTEILCGSYVANLMSMKLSVHMINDFKRDCKVENNSILSLPASKIFFCDFFEQDGTADDVRDHERKIKYECKLIMTIEKIEQTRKVIYQMETIVRTLRCSFKCDSSTFHALSISSQTFEHNSVENCEIITCEEMMTSKLSATNKMFKQYTILKTNPSLLCIFNRRQNHGSINSFSLMTNAENIIYDLNYAEDYMISDCSMSSEDEVQARYSLLPHLPVFNLELKCSGSTVNLISMHMSDYEMELENECQPGAISRISIVRDQNDVYFCDFNREDPTNAGNYEMENIYGCKLILTMEEITESQKVVYTMRTIAPALRCPFKCGSEIFHALTMSSQTFERDLGATCEIVTCEEMITSKLKTTNKLFKQYTVLKTNPPQICSLKHKHGINRRTYSIMTNADNIIYDLNNNDDYVVEDCAETSQPDGRVRYGLLPHIPAFTLEMKCGDITISLLSVNPSDHEIMFIEQSDCYAQDFDAIPSVQDIQRPSFAWDEGAAESIPSRFSVYRQFLIPKTPSPLTCTFSSTDSPSLKLYTHGKWSKGFYINDEATGTSYTDVVCQKIEVLESSGNGTTTIEIPSTDRLMKMDVTVNTQLYTLVSGIKYSRPSIDIMTYHYETYVPVFEVIRADRKLTYELPKIYPQVQCLYDSYENATLAYSDYYTDQTRSISFPAPQDLEFQSDRVKITNCIPILVPCGSPNEEVIMNHDTMLSGEQCFKMQIPKFIRERSNGDILCTLNYNTTEEVRRFNFYETDELPLTDEMRHTFTIRPCASFT